MNSDDCDVYVALTRNESELRDFDFRDLADRIASQIEEMDSAKVHLDLLYHMVCHPSAKPGFSEHWIAPNDVFRKVAEMYVYYWMSNIEMTSRDKGVTGVDRPIRVLSYKSKNYHPHQCD